MNTPTTSYGASGLTGYPCQPGISNMHTGNTTHNILGDSNTNSGNVLNSYNNTINVGASDETLRIQAWLSPLEPYRRHHDVRSRRLGGVGDWVLRENEFALWRDGLDGSVNPTLLCYGGQGVGKTYISSLVIDALYERTCGRNIAVLSLYCDYKSQKDQTAVNMIGGLLRQVAVQAAEIPGEIRSAFVKSRRKGGNTPLLPEVLGLFIKTIGSFERVYICFDAVDELAQEHRSQFLRALHQITQDAPNLRIFLTGRHHIRRELDKHLTKGAHTIHIVADQGDIGRYISQKIDEDDDRDRDLMTENLKNDIMKTLCEKSSEMFLLVALNIDAILGETSLGRRKKMLQKVATTGVDLDSVYAQTLQRIREQKGDRSGLGMEVLMWVSHAERPLRIDELCHALAVEMGNSDLDPEYIRPQDTVLGSCLGLVVVDKETSTVRLIHYTLQEYLSRPGILPGAHKKLAQSCLAYLNYEQVKGLAAVGDSKIAGMPFLEYSSLYWGIHAKVELSDHAKSLALQLLNRFDSHISAALLLNRIHGDHDCSLPKHLFTGLHGASYFGVVEVLAALIERGGCDINQRDCTGLTPLTWAAIQGTEQVVRLLRSRDDVDPNISDYFGNSPLSLASNRGYEGVVRLLLSWDDIDLEKANTLGLTPLWLASANAREGVVRLLLARGDINPDKPSKYNETPLWVAASSGNAGVVSLLLMRGDVDPNKRSSDGQTPLWSASLRGYDGVVRLLLTRNDVDPNKPDHLGYPPLWCASLTGNEGMVRLLLTRHDVDRNKPNKYGQTPLQIAAERGHTRIVALLRHRESAGSILDRAPE